MAANLEDLFCPICTSYAHPFLAACPACGTARRSRYSEASATPDLGIRALLADPGVIGRLREVVLRYSLKLASGPQEMEVRAGLATLADALAYRARAVGARAVASERAHLELTDDELLVRERNPARDLLRVPLDLVLAVGHRTAGRPAGAWAGLAFGGQTDQLTAPPVEGDLVVTWAGPAGLGRLGVANRRALLAAHARPDHYATLARWLGLVAASAAEARWVAVGARRHAAQLGLVAGSLPGAGGGAMGVAVADGAGAMVATGSTVAAGGAGPDAGVASPAPEEGATAAPAQGAPGGAAAVRAALEALEELRTAGLVSAGEYAEKRREILSRL